MLKQYYYHCFDDYWQILQNRFSRNFTKVLMLFFWLRRSKEIKDISLNTDAFTNLNFHENFFPLSLFFWQQNSFGSELSAIPQVKRSRTCVMSTVLVIHVNRRKKQ